MQEGSKDNAQSLKIISDYLVKHNETLAVAESVTSGDLQAQFSLPTGSMQFFQGGITAYNLTQKVHHLHIDPIHAMSCNCVSAIVALEMAKNVSQSFKTDWGIGVTGYASPVPEKDVSDLYAHVSICHKGKPILSTVMQAEKRDPVAVREFYVREILAQFSAALKSYQPNK